MEFWVPISVHSWSEANINNTQMSKAATKLRAVWSNPAWSGRLQGSVVNTSRLQFIECLYVSPGFSFSLWKMDLSVSFCYKTKPRGLKQWALILSYNTIGYPFAFGSSPAWLVSPVTDGWLGADAPRKPPSHLWWEGGLYCLILQEARLGSSHGDLRKCSFQKLQVRASPNANTFQAPSVPCL